MSSDNFAIRVEGVSKRFELYDRPSDQLRQFLYPKIQTISGIAPKTYFREFWALRNVSLSVRKGESCGIVGMNGSGKSTLLQIITGTLFPTNGSVTLQGRVAALLELGSGFNPKFTGRENVYLNGALLGYTREQVADRIDDIRAFADIDDHFDLPLSTYSSGMQMRVAFAVATAFEPNILIIDEALAVGDAYFQQKCFHKLEDFKQNGGTLLFVSHDSNTVKHLCDTALLMSHGVAMSYGAPRDVIDLYHGLIAQTSDMSGNEFMISQKGVQNTGWQKATTITTNDEAELVDFKLLDSGSQQIKCIESENQLTVQYVVRLKKDFDRPAFGLIVRDRTGRSIYETSTYAMRMLERSIQRNSEVSVKFSFNINLRAGQYSFSIGVANRGFARSEFEEYSLLMHDVEQLQVIESQTADFYGGVFNMHATASIDVIGFNHDI